MMTTVKKGWAAKSKAIQPQTAFCRNGRGKGGVSAVGMKLPGSGAGGDGHPLAGIVKLPGARSQRLAQNRG
ncbi:hypothetical protein GCM10011335_00310 [Aureimonas glaciei]|uniref:Uncharacterized protein n=1 Tax=Aureimonas glaciei TaxID=1776957 RepID=A0A916XRA9_9HYPH|nr:hypothetical protein GCM10011335_00310 [Aureimonas glaciei]